MERKKNKTANKRIDRFLKKLQKHFPDEDTKLGQILSVEEVRDIADKCGLTDLDFAQLEREGMRIPSCTEELLLEEWTIAWIRERKPDLNKLTDDQAKQLNKDTLDHFRGNKKVIDYLFRLWLEQQTKEILAELGLSSTGKKLAAKKKKP